MSLLKPRTWGISKVYRDIKNYIEFKRIIIQEEQDPYSKFNKWKLTHNRFGTIFVLLDVDENEAQLPMKIMRMRMIESLAPLHRYLDEELGFAECLVPEFNQFFDEDNNPTLTYLISYRFGFEKLSLWWVVKWLLAISTLIIFTQLNIIQWIMSLI